MTDTELKQRDYLHEVRRTHLEVDVDSDELQEKIGSLLKVAKKFSYDDFIIHYSESGSHIYFPREGKCDLSDLIHELSLIGIKGWNIPVMGALPK